MSRQAATAQAQAETGRGTKRKEPGSSDDDQKDGRYSLRGKKWGSVELQQLLDAWVHCSAENAGIDEVPAKFQQRLYERLVETCTGECGGTDRVCRRTSKSVRDKLNSIGRMYRFIREFDTHKIIDGSEGLRDWYKCGRKTRKAFCRKFDLKGFDKSIFEQLTSILANNIGPAAAMGCSDHQHYGRMLPPEGFGIDQDCFDELKQLATVVEKHKEAITELMQEWRRTDQDERENQRRAKAEERAKEREMLVAGMKAMLDAIAPQPPRTSV